MNSNRSRNFYANSNRKEKTIVIAAILEILIAMVAKIVTAVAGMIAIEIAITIAIVIAIVIESPIAVERGIIIVISKLL